jgi:hypothetical protein
LLSRYQIRDREGTDDVRTNGNALVGTACRAGLPSRSDPRTLGRPDRVGTLRLRHPGDRKPPHPARPYPGGAAWSDRSDGTGGLCSDPDLPHALGHARTLPAPGHVRPTATERYQIRRAQPPFVMRDRSDLHSVHDATEGLVWSADLLPRPSFLPCPGAADRDRPVAALRTSPQAAGAPRLVSRPRVDTLDRHAQWMLGQRTPAALMGPKSTAGLPHVEAGRSALRQCQ